jgi:hypothetical protein
MQRGATMWMLLGMSALFILFALIAMKLIPGYMDNAKVENALQSVAESPGAANMGRRQIINKVADTLYIDGGADDLLDLRTALVITKRGDKKIISIDYERVIPMAFNISVLLDFENSVEISLR